MHGSSDTQRCRRRALALMVSVGVLSTVLAQGGLANAQQARTVQACRVEAGPQFDETNNEMRCWYVGAEDGEDVKATRLAQAIRASGGGEVFPQLPEGSIDIPIDEGGAQAIGAAILESFGVSSVAEMIETEEFQRRINGLSGPRKILSIESAGANMAGPWLVAFSGDPNICASTAGRIADLSKLFDPRVEEANGQPFNWDNQISSSRQFSNCHMMAYDEPLNGVGLPRDASANNQASSLLYGVRPLEVKWHKYDQRYTNPRETYPESWSLIATDSGTGSQGTGRGGDVSFYRPDRTTYVGGQLEEQEWAKGGWYSLGDVAVVGEHGYEGSDSLPQPVLVARDVGDTLAAPDGYQKVWDDAGTDGDVNFSIWKPNPPSPDYVCLGHVASREHDYEPSNDDMRCVHERYVAPGRSLSLWADHESDGDSNVEIYESLPADTAGVQVGSTFVAREYYDDAGPSEDFKTLRLSTTTMPFVQPKEGSKEAAGLSLWTAADSLIEQQNSLAYPNPSGADVEDEEDRQDLISDQPAYPIPNWIIRAYCNSVGYAGGDGTCSVETFAEEKRTSFETAYRQPLVARENNCTVVQQARTKSWSTSNSTAVATSRDYAVTNSFTVTFTGQVAPEGVGGSVATAFGFSFSSAIGKTWTSSTATTETDTAFLYVPPGYWGWADMAKYRGEAHGIAQVRVNGGLDWSRLPSAGGIQGSPEVQRLERLLGDKPIITGAAGAETTVPVVTFLSGDLPAPNDFEIAALNAQDEIGLTPGGYEMSDEEIDTCVENSPDVPAAEKARTKQLVKAARDNVATGLGVSVRDEDGNEEAEARLVGGSPASVE